MDNNFSCYLCKSNDFSIIAEPKQIRFECYGFEKRIVMCTKCQLVQLYPQWNDEQLQSLYSKYSNNEEFKGFKQKKTITKYIESYMKKDDFILEVGCGSGDNLRRFRGKGYNVIGIDKDPTVCDGRIVLNYGYQDFIPKERKFNLIYAIQVFEHITDPLDFIIWLINSLENNGIFLLELPNINDPLLTICNNTSFRNFYWYPYHLFFYNKNTIERLFENITKVKVKVSLLQRYGLINHLRWFLFHKPGNFNPNIPLVDTLYKFLLMYILKSSDTLVVLGEKKP